MLWTLPPIIWYKRMENLEPTNDVLPNKLGSVRLFDLCQGFSFNPFGKIINSKNSVASYPFIWVVALWDQFFIYQMARGSKPQLVLERATFELWRNVDICHTSSRTEVHFSLKLSTNIFVLVSYAYVPAFVYGCHKHLREFRECCNYSLSLLVYQRRG